MQRLLPWLALAACVALPLWLWGTTRPPSDNALMRRFAEQRSALDQLVVDVQRHRVPLYIGSWITLWPENLPERGIEVGRIAQYRNQLRQAGVTSVSSDDDGAIVAFNTHTTLLGSVKSFVYSPMRPPTLTEGSTEAYRFASGQFRRVCRPLADAWYLCLDHED
jgi:hypothetical protein